MQCIRRVHRARLIVSVSYLFLRYEDTIPISLRYFATVRRAIFAPPAVKALCYRAVRERGVLRKHLPDAPPGYNPRSHVSPSGILREKKPFRANMPASDIRYFPATALLTVEGCTPSSSAISDILRGCSASSLRKNPAAPKQFFPPRAQHRLPRGPQTARSVLQAPGAPANMPLPRRQARQARKRRLQTAG